MFEFLREYINKLPESIRENPEFGFNLEDGLSSSQIESIKGEISKFIPKEIINFYLYANGGQLGEYTILPLETLEVHQHQIMETYGRETTQRLVPFAIVKGVGDYIIIDCRDSKKPYPDILDGFHEYAPNKWEKIADSLSDWLQRMCESNFTPYWQT
jgi:hypothetical protein